MESYRIWIDYNRDGDFFDAEDLAFARFVTDNGRVQGSFTVPANALSGLARMRVQVKRDAVPFSPCETLPQGETEDYLVRIMAPELLGQRIALPAGSAEAVDAMAVYPNPAGPRAFLLLPPSQGPAAVEVFGLDGRRVLQGRSEDGRCALDLSGLPAGWYMATATFEASGLRQSVKFVVE
jgi:hypothetical protein